MLCILVSWTCNASLIAVSPAGDTAHKHQKVLNQLRNKNGILNLKEIDLSKLEPEYQQYIEFLLKITTPPNDSGQ